MSKKSSTRVAYSYVRYSSEEQRAGGSLERQLKATREYCERHNLQLNESLKPDEACSAFRGKNATEGHLAAFIYDCENGRVAPGSVLIIESLDRLSRNKVQPTLKLFLTLQEFGVTIVTLKPEKVYNPDKSTYIDYIEPLVYFMRANEESEIKSHRRRDGWKRAREKAASAAAKGKCSPVASWCPAWLQAVRDDGVTIANPASVSRDLNKAKKSDAAGFTLRPEVAALVRRIFTMAADGLGTHRIVQHLVKEGVPPIGRARRWGRSYVHTLLVNRAVIGEYQPMRMEGKKKVPDGKPISGYYPPVITTEMWDKVQAALHRRRNGEGSGRAGRDEANVFSRLVWCAVNKQRMRIIRANSRPRGDTRHRVVSYKYLASTKPDGDTISHGLTIDYGHFESRALNYFLQLNPSEVIGTEPNSSASGRHQERQELQRRLDDIKDNKEKVIARRQQSPNSEALMDLLLRYEEDEKPLKERLRELDSEPLSEPEAELNDVQALIRRLYESTDEERPELRRRLKQRIRALVGEMWVWIHHQGKGKPKYADVQVFFRAGGRDFFQVMPKSGTLPTRELSPTVDLRDLQVEQPPHGQKSRSAR
jgi:DNA invertase Pin-like site-specific DNA recombinase